jgi:acetyl-CoA synthetase
MIPSTLFDIAPTDAFNIGIACTEPEIKGHSAETTAVIVDQDGQTSQHLSYAQLAEQSNRFANALHALGSKKQDRIMLWLPNSIAFPIAFFGSLKQGAIAVPCSTLLTGEEIEYLAKDSGAGILVTSSKLWQRFQDAGATSHEFKKVILIDESESPPLIRQNTVSAPPPVTILKFHQLIALAPDTAIKTGTIANDPAYLVYTSGTTGFPKGVLHAHRALLGRLPSASHWFDYQQTGDRILHSGKFNWTYVLGTALMDPLLLGKTVVVYEGESTAATWPSLIAKHACTIFIGVPTIYRQILQKTNASAGDVPSLRHCMCAGEHLSDEMLSLWRARFQQNIYEAIGMSECSYYLSQHTSSPIKPGSAGFPQPGHQIHLLDEHMQAVEDNQEGMLCIGLNDPGLFIKYWGLPETTKETRQHGYFLTGDYAQRDEDGYFWFLGRRDDIINSFGFRISPHEIERVMKTHPLVSDCVALEEQVTADKTLVVACIIARDNKQLEEHALIEFAQSHLASYKVPKKVYQMKEFPRTANGKIIRKALKALL